MNFKPGQLVRRTKLSTHSFVTPEQEATGELKVLYHNGTLLLEDNFETIRTRAQQ